MLTIHTPLRLGLVLFLLAFATPVIAGEAHYLIMFGSQKEPNNPNYTHSFAAFVRATWDDLNPGPPRIETHAISWLPCNTRVRIQALLPECGRNFELHETIRLLQSTGQRVTMWGPLQIQPELYHLALNRLRLLESGCPRYKVNDIGFHSDRVFNCIHALDSIVRGSRRMFCVPCWGDKASRAVLDDFKPWIIDTQRTHDWLIPVLHLEQYQLRRCCMNGR